MLTLRFDKETIAQRVWSVYATFLWVWLIALLAMALLRFPHSLMACLYIGYIVTIVVFALVLGYAESKIKYFNYRVSFAITVKDCTEQ